MVKRAKKNTIEIREKIKFVRKVNMVSPNGEEKRQQESIEI